MPVTAPAEVIDLVRLRLRFQQDDPPCGHFLAIDQQGDQLVVKHFNADTGHTSVLVCEPATVPSNGSLLAFFRHAHIVSPPARHRTSLIHCCWGAADGTPDQAAQ